MEGFVGSWWKDSVKVRDKLVHRAAKEVCVNVVKLLFSYSSNAMVLACLNGHFQVVKFLVQNGAVLDDAGFDGWAVFASL